MAIKRTTKIDPSFSMSSMTDIVFLLLIFFLITSTLVNPNALELLLPKSNNQGSDNVPVKVYIKDCRALNGAVPFEYAVQEGKEEIQKIKFQDLDGALYQILSERAEDERAFSINTDKTVPVKEIVELMNIAKKRGYKVILATSPE